MRKNWRSFFLDCEQVEKVIYPGLGDEDQTEIAARILNKNYRGAVLGIRLKTDSREAVYKIYERAKTLHASGKRRRYFLPALFIRRPRRTANFRRQNALGSELRKGF